MAPGAPHRGKPRKQATGLAATRGQIRNTHYREGALLPALCPVSMALLHSQGAVALTGRCSRGRMAHHHAQRTSDDARTARHAIGVAAPLSLAARIDVARDLGADTGLALLGTARLPAPVQVCLPEWLSELGLHGGHERSGWATRPSPPTTMARSARTTDDVWTPKWSPTDDHQAAAPGAHKLGGRVVGSFFHDE